jgi:hypothetical protein
MDIAQKCDGHVNVSASECNGMLLICSHKNLQSLEELNEQSSLPPAPLHYTSHVFHCFLAVATRELVAWCLVSAYEGIKFMYDIRGMLTAIIILLES